MCAIHIVGRRVRIRQSELDRFLASGKIRTATAGAEAEPVATDELATAVAEFSRRVGADDVSEPVGALRAMAADAGKLGDALERQAQTKGG